MSRTVSSSALPSAMAVKLRAIRRRQAALAVARAVAVSASVLIVLMIAAMIIDWSLMLFDTRVRIALTVTTLGLAACTLLRTGIPPLIEAFGWLRAAASADDDVPQLEERWTTVANFATSEHQPASPEAKAMLEQVRSEAIAMGRLVRPQRVARPTALRPAALTLAGSLLLLIAFLELNWAQTSVLLQRFWSPTADITATQLTSLTGDVMIPRGETLEIVTEMAGLPRNAARLTLKHESGLVDVFDLTPDAEDERSFIHAMRAESSFRYRLRAGDGQTDWHAVHVIDYPAFSDVRFTVTAPEYVDRPPVEKALIPNRVRVVQGSRLELLMKPVAPLKRLDVTLSFVGENDESTEQVLTLTPDAQGWYRFETPLVADVSLSPTLLNSYGLTNEDKPVCRIQVVPDKAPVARIISPTDEMAVAADEVIDIEFEAHDDHGIASAELVVYEESETAEGDEPKILRVEPIPLGEKRFQKHLLAETQLDLKALNLPEGTDISYAIRVTDNRTVEFEQNAMAARTASSMADEKDDHSRESDTERRATEVAEGTEETRTDTSEAPQETLLADAREAIDASRSANKPAVPNSQADDSENRNWKGSDTADSSATSDEERRADSARDSQPGDPKKDTSAGKGNSTREDNSAVGKPDPSAEKPEGSLPTTTDANTDSPETSEDKPTTSAASSGRNAREPQNSNGPKKSAADSSEKTSRESDEPSESADSRTPMKSGNPEGTEPSGEPKASDPPEGSEESKGDPKGDPKGKPAATPNPASDTPADAASNSLTQGKAPTESAEVPQDGDQDETETAVPAEDDAKPEPTGRMGDAEEPASRPNDSREADDGNQSGSRVKGSETQSPSESSSGGPSGGSGNRPTDAPPPAIAMNAKPSESGQKSEPGQNAETGRRRLKIAERLGALAAAEERRSDNLETRDRILEIDKKLAEVESGLTRVVEREIPDADRSEQFRILDHQLGDVEAYIAELRSETEGGQFAFVGLQMVDIARTHVTPARDRVFVAIRDASGADELATDALQHIVRARELLAALLKRYERVARDRELAEALDEAIEIYEVYVEESHRLMREARQNKNPLERKMAVIEVDQEYLDRYAEVLTLRREMLKEFARLLGDDPRLMARYMDLIKRRRMSLRDQLSELAERQDEISTELSGWQAVPDAQRENLWMLISEMRLHTATELAQDAAELAERVEKQMPLVLETSHGTAAQVIQQVQEIAKTARTIAFEVRQMFQSEETETPATLTRHAEHLVDQFGELEASLDRLNFENESSDEVTRYVRSRLLESRTVADRAGEWEQVAHHIQKQNYPGLASVDQQKLGISTELLHVEMLDIETDLEGQFQQVTENDVPGEIIDLVRRLHRVMESITFHQAATTFALSTEQLDEAEIQQTKALERFDEAERLFDEMRRAVVSALDEYDRPNPNIAALQDPTLDEFLARLEREPNIEAQLGIPNRPSNLRVIADLMDWQEEGELMLGASSEAAMNRAREAMERQRAAVAQREKRETELSDEERKQLAEAKEMQDMLEKSLASIREKLDDPEMSAEQRRRLQQMAQNMQRMLDQSRQQDAGADEWERIVESDQTKAVLRALAQGKAIPDDQWNKLLSTLEDGLWQVRGKTPPEEYRRAIEQYQDRLRQLTDAVGTGAE